MAGKINGRMLRQLNELNPDRQAKIYLRQTKSGQMCIQAKMIVDSRPKANCPGIHFHRMDNVPVRSLVLMLPTLNVVTP